MSYNNDYSEKLKDPHWQKKRLEILKRDDFKCRNCYNDSKTLHVHHIYYLKEYKNPWEYDNDLLITLCESCHEIEHSYLIEDISINIVRDILRLCNCTISELSTNWFDQTFYYMKVENYTYKEALKKSIIELIKKT
jgi:hypothetical protein